MSAKPVTQHSGARSLPDVSRLLTRERIERYPLMLFAVTVLVYLVGLAQATRCIEPGGRIIGHDYLAFYMAGDMVNRGQLAHLYDAAAQTDYQQRFMKNINPHWSGTCLYLNPPHYAWAMSWLAALGYGPALVVWWLLSGGCFVATALLWRRWLTPERAHVAILLAVCLPAWFWTLAGGQNTLFSLLILTAFCTLLMQRRDVWAGVVLALLAYKFQLLIVPAGLLLLKGRWRALAGLGVGGLATLGLTAATLGPQAIADYVAFGSQLGHLMQVEGFDVFKQHSWHGFFALLGAGWMSPMAVRILTAIASVATLVVLGVIWRGKWAAGTTRFTLQLAALIVATLLTSPHLFHYDMLLVTLPAVLWYRAAQEAPTAAAVGTVKPLLAAGFIWLAVSSVVTGIVPIQLSAALMFVWLVVLGLAAVGTMRPGSTAAGRPGRTALVPQLPADACGVQSSPITLRSR